MQCFECFAAMLCCSTSSTTSKQASTSAYCQVISLMFALVQGQLRRDSFLGYCWLARFASSVASTARVVFQHASPSLVALLERIAQVFLTDNMAAEAHKRASKVMDAATEAKLAKIINSDLEQLREKAEGEFQEVRSAAGVCNSSSFAQHERTLCPAVQGVLAYGLNPVRRERLNERFLQNTLKSVGYGEIAAS